MSRATVFGERTFPAKDVAQPRSRERPFRFHRRGGQIQCGGCFLDREAGEVPQHDDLCLAAVETLQLIERVVDRQHVGRVGARCGRLARDIDTMLFAAVLQPMMVPRTLHEDAAHRDGRGGEEVPAAVPAAACTGIIGTAARAATMTSARSGWTLRDMLNLRK